MLQESNLHICREQVYILFSETLGMSRHMVSIVQTELSGLKEPTRLDVYATPSRETLPYISVTRIS